MKRFAVTVVLAAVAALAVAQPMRHDRMLEPPFASETRKILAPYADKVPSELTFAEREQLAGELSVPMQEAAFVRMSAFSSFLTPGAGQILNKDYLSGSLFMLGDLAIAAGTLTAVYFLLPPELQFDHLNYYTASHSEITTAWQNAMDSMSLQTSLPIIGVAAGGMILAEALAGFSAAHAAKLATDRIESGDITFQPRPDLVLGPAGQVGFRFHMRY